jgi:hypothetical protein
MWFCTSAFHLGVPVACEFGNARRGLTWLAALLLAMLPFAARAADDDLPGRVGRIADFAGQLFLSPQDRPTDWEPIGINYPITSGDNLWVSGDGRAEVDYGGGQFRMSGDTSVHVSRLDDRQLALFIAQGRLLVRVRSLDPGDATRVDTPNTQVALTRPGLYRIDVAPDREATTLTVREGEAQVALAYGAQQALPGQTVSVVGANALNADIRNGIGVDGFDTWSADRDRRYEFGRSTVHVSREMVGYADLDEHGTWQSYPDYGAVWFPSSVAPGWAPYSDGYWTHVGGWGPTWVDRAPWGYAPFHYGRWARIGGRWGWCPGGYVARPIWAPALVAWFGGPGWGLSLRQGGPVYGWVPLGWGEAYHPNWRRCSYNCWAHYNRPYAVNVAVRTNAPPARYANIAVPGALSAVAAPALVGRRPVGNERVDVPVSLASSAPVMAGVPPVAQAPRPGPDTGRGTLLRPPPGASTHARAPRPDQASPDAAYRPATNVTPLPDTTAGTPPASAPAARPGPGSSGTPPSTAPALRERGRAQPPQEPRSRDPVITSAPPRPEPSAVQVPAQANDATRQTRREPSRTRDIPAAPAALPPAPSGAGVAPPAASRAVPNLPSAGRAAPPASPGLAGADGRASPAAPPAAAMPAPPAGAQPAPAAPASAKGARSSERPAPDPPAAGTGAVR